MSKRATIFDSDVDGDVNNPDDHKFLGNNQKRSKIDNNQLVSYKETSQSLATTVNLRNASLVLSEKASRWSSLSNPELHLTGHEGAIYTIDFDPTGQHLSSGSIDQKICKCRQYLFYILFISCFLFMIYRSLVGRVW